MRLYFFSPYDIRRARTNQISDVRLCEGFSQNGCDVTLIVPFVFRRDNLAKSEVFRAYGVTQPYRVVTLWTLFWDDMPEGVRILVLLLCNFVSSMAVIAVNIRRLSDVVIISRDMNLLLPSVILKKVFRLKRGPTVVAWAHEVLLSKKQYAWVYKNSTGVIGTNSMIVEDLRKELGISPSRLAVSLNPVSESQLRCSVTKNQAREELGISPGTPLIVYTGKLYLGQRESEYILEAARQLPDYRFLLTGGKPNVVKHYQEWCARHTMRNVSFSGFLYRYDRMQMYQIAADVLVSYYSMHDHNIRYNLPNKICEYMLTGNPAVVARTPAVVDILNSRNSILVEPDNSAALIDAIRSAVENESDSKSLAQQARADVESMTFKRRTKLLLEFFSQLSSASR